MKKFLVVAISAGLTLSACSSSDSDDDGATGNSATDGGTGTASTPGDTSGAGSGTDQDSPSNGVSGDLTLPPGTASPTPDFGIARSEPTQAQGGKEGDGFATDVRYDAATDTFFVDNLAFDGANDYRRGTLVSSLGPYAVYEALPTLTDPNNGTDISQFTYRAIYGVSGSGNVQFAIVRTGSYVGYGFGGFVYQRNDGVNLPTSGQGIYTGTTSGIVDFDGVDNFTSATSNLAYSTGDITVIVDFEDFNPNSGQAGDAVRGSLSNRRYFDINGTDITQDIVDNINTNATASIATIPTLRFVISPSYMDANGEIVGQVNSTFVNDNGQSVQFETGNYYALLSGDADEIVGVIVAENSLASEAQSTTVRETSGFIAER